LARVGDRRKVPLEVRQCSAHVRHDRKDSVSYGQRWIAENISSCIKRMFGEYVTAIRFENMIKEMVLKTSLYNLFQSITVR
jgi:hypothetical protein